MADIVNMKEAQFSRALARARLGQAGEALAACIVKSAEADPPAAIQALLNMRGRPELSEFELAHHLGLLGGRNPAARLHIIESVLHNKIREPQYLLAPVIAACGPDIHTAIEMIASSAHPQKERLLGSVAERHQDTFETVCDLLEGIGTAEAQDALIETGTRCNRYADILKNFTRIGTPDAAERLSARLTDTMGGHRAETLEALAHFPGDASVRALERYARITGSERAFEILEGMGTKEALDTIGKTGALSLSLARGALPALFNGRAKASETGRVELYDENLRTVLNKVVRETRDIARAGWPREISFFRDAFRRADDLHLAASPYTPPFDRAVSLVRRQQAFGEVSRKNADRFIP